MEPFAPTAKTERRAYTAGIIDGEGSIFLARQRNKRGDWRYYPVVTVSNTSGKLIRWLRRNVRRGGPVVYWKPSHKNAKPAGRWIVYSQDAAAVLLEVLPYLVIKRKQAQLVLRFSQMFAKGKSVRHRAKRQKALWDRLKVLNCRGRRGCASSI